MGKTPRQRRKVRNVSAKTTKKQRHPKKVNFGATPPIVVEHWDRNLTLQQNYTKFGLVAVLGGQAGGIDKADINHPRSKLKQSAQEEVDCGSSARNAIVEYGYLDSTPAAAGLNSRMEDDDGSEDDTVPFIKDDEEFDVDGPMTLYPTSNLSSLIFNFPALNNMGFNFLSLDMAS